MQMTESKYNCHICNKAFKLEKNYIKHTTICTIKDKSDDDNQKYLFEHCGNKFVHKKDMVRHIKTRCKVSQLRKKEVEKKEMEIELKKQEIEKRENELELKEREVELEKKEIQVASELKILNMIKVGVNLLTTGKRGKFCKEG